MQLHLDKGDVVYRFICNGDLSICDMNKNHELGVCLKCRDIRKSGGSLLEGEVINLTMVKKYNFNLPEQLIDCKNVEDLKKVYFENFDVGYAIASTIITLSRNPEFNIASNFHSIKEYYQSAVNLYLSTVDYIKKYKPDVVYLFNGRFAHVRAILRACEITKTKFIVHERGANKDKYDLFLDKMPHDKSFAIDRMERQWASDADTLEKKIKVGSNFFISRKNGKPGDWLSFTKDQDKALLPADFDRNKINVAIFNSSVDEFAAISQDWAYPFFDSQEEFIETLARLFQNEPDYHFYLRVHPNLKGLNNGQISQISKLNSPNLTVISADSKVGSYTLLDNCNQVITFGSTMGIEAAFWAKPSILVSTGFYSGESVYMANSYSEVVDLIKSDLKPKNKLGALKYGYYYSTRGIEFKYFKAVSLFSGLYKGVNVMLYNSRLSRFIKYIYNIRIIGKPIAMYAAYYKKNRIKLPLK